MTAQKYKILERSKWVYKNSRCDRTVYLAMTQNVAHFLNTKLYLLVANPFPP
jgi:hypothetical protein